jgi:hypothetical protein
MAGNLKLLAGLAAGYVLGPGRVASATSGSPRLPAGWPSGPRSASSPASSGPASGPAWRRPPAPPVSGSSRPEARTAPPRTRTRTGPRPAGRRPPGGRYREPARHPGRGRTGSWRGPRRDRVATVPGRRGGGGRWGRRRASAGGASTVSDRSGPEPQWTLAATLSGRRPTLMLAGVRTAAQESFLGSPQGPPSTTIWATSATGRRDDRAADRMRW